MTASAPWHADSPPVTMAGIRSPRQLRQRIDQFDTGKSPEIVVGGGNCAAILDSECCQMCIRREVSCHSAAEQEIPEHRPVLLAGADEGYVRLSQPFVYRNEGLFYCQRFAQNAGASDDPDEGQNDDPRQADTGIAGQCLLKPTTRARVMRRVGVDSLDQQIGVEQDHLRKSSSRAISSSSSATASLKVLSMSMPGKTPPSETAFNRYGFGGAASFAARPDRRISFRTCLKGLPERWARDFSALAIRSSSVRVVLISIAKIASGCHADKHQSIKRRMKA